MGFDRLALEANDHRITTDLIRGHWQPKLLADCEDHTHDKLTTEDHTRDKTCFPSA